MSRNIEGRQLDSSAFLKQSRKEQYSPSALKQIFPQPREKEHINRRGMPRPPYRKPNR